ncbi:DUF3040 domain-containing protein [Symbioplanes lichenis]|uniref:DUF3040 domain-containing protein n=1 Tax=Symbioplanes lichenis TaxID=1629072 RepID=UPI0027381C7D|nr:DUF3040 domain-containing protein [Actinoplanes lichenis]
MLSSYDRRRFNEIVSGLLEEDPGFGTRQVAEPRELPRRPVVALLLWASMPFLVALGGGTGALLALLAAVYGLRLWFRGTDRR